MNQRPVPNADTAAVHTAMRGGSADVALPGNPMATMLNARIVAAQPDFVALEFEPSDNFLQGAEVLQGGAVTAMLDFAMAFATLTGVSATGSCGTINLNVSFLRAAHPGRYRAEGRVEKRGKTIAFANAQLTAEGAEAPIAIATSTLVVRAE